MLEAFLVSTGIVAVAEIGDRTQLLTLLLVARLGHPWAIVAGILVATLANHALAAVVGSLLGTVVDDQMLRWILGLSFIAMAVWALKPDKLESEDAPTRTRLGVLFATLIAFFLVEMGDKTQIATAALAARYDTLVVVILGTTLGMMAANVPVALCGEALMRKLPLNYIRWAAAALFALVGFYTLLKM